MAIHIDASRKQGIISPLIYGAVGEWFDKYLDDKSKYWADTVKKVAAAGITNFRMGGDSTDHYHWKDPDNSPAPGYAEEDQKVACNVDSLMKFAQSSGMRDIVMGVNFLTGTAKEAAEWVKYCNIEKKYGIKYWEIGNELGYPAAVPTWFHNSARKYYFGGCELQKGEKLGVSNGADLQILSLAYPPVKDRLKVYIGSSAWQQVDNLKTSGKGNFYQYREVFTPGLYYKGEILFGDGSHGNVPAEGTIITADYNSGPHDGLIDYISRMKAVDPTIEVTPCGDELDWYSENVTEWTKTLLELDSAQTDPHKEFDFIAPHWHPIQHREDNYSLVKLNLRARNIGRTMNIIQALHRQDNFDHCVQKLREAIIAAYEVTKPNKINLPIFVNEWKAVDVVHPAFSLQKWGDVYAKDSPPETSTPQGLWTLLFVADALGKFAKNNITQASMTHIHAFFGTDGILAYEDRDAQYKPNQEMPIFYVFQLMRSKFGEVMIECSYEESSLHLYASLDRKKNPGRLTLLGINRESTFNLRSLIKISGFSPQTTANVWILNGDGIDLSTGININGVRLEEIDATQMDKITPGRIVNVSDSFSYTFPAHSIVMMQLSSETCSDF